MSVAGVADTGDATTSSSMFGLLEARARAPSFCGWVRDVAVAREASDQAGERGSCKREARAAGREW